MEISNFEEYIESYRGHVTESTTREEVSAWLDYDLANNQSPTAAEESEFVNENRDEFIDAILELA